MHLTVSAVIRAQNAYAGSFAVRSSIVYIFSHPCCVWQPLCWAKMLDCLAGAYRLRSIGKSGFRVLQSNAKSENGFHLREIRPYGGFQLRNPNMDFMDFLLLFDWEIRKRTCKTILVNCGLLFANYAWACKAVVLKNCLSNPFSDFPKNGKKGNSRPDISVLKSVFRFRVRLQIQNPDFKI